MQEEVKQEVKKQEPEKQMTQEQLEAFWRSKVAEARRHLKQCSKNELVRTVIQLQIRNYELEAQMEKILNKENENEVSDNSSDSAE